MGEQNPVLGKLLDTMYKEHKKHEKMWKKRGGGKLTNEQKMKLVGYHQALLDFELFANEV